MILLSKRGTLCLAAALAAWLAAAQPALAGPGQEQSATGVAVAEIVAPLTVTAITDLDFGGVALQTGNSGSMTLDPVSGSASYIGVGPIACGEAACMPQPAQFEINGIAGRQYRIVLPESAVANLVGGGGSPLQVSAITSASANLPGGIDRGLLGGDGNDLLTVGGTLDIPSGTAPGHYAAQITLVVSYD